MKIAELVTTEELARQVRLMTQLRVVRDFAKEERMNAKLEDQIVWERLYRTVLGGIKDIETAIAKILPSREYHFFRDFPRD